MLRNAARELRRARQAPQHVGSLSLRNTRLLSYSTNRHAATASPLKSPKPRELERTDESSYWEEFVAHRAPESKKPSTDHRRHDQLNDFSESIALFSRRYGQMPAVASREKPDSYTAGFLNRAPSHGTEPRFTRERQGTHRFATKTSNIDRSQHIEHGTTAEKSAPRLSPESEEQMKLNDELQNLAHYPEDVSEETEGLKIDSVEPSEEWFSNKSRRRKIEHRLKTKKSWATLSPNLMLKYLLVTQIDNQEVRRKTAMARSMRMPVVLMQMMIRKEEEEIDPSNSEILRLLPDSLTWKKILALLEYNGFSKGDLEHYLDILKCESDQMRCDRFLEQQTFKPLWILNFLIRKHSTILEVGTLVALMNYFEAKACDSTKESQSSQARKELRTPQWDVSPENFNLATTLFANHCMRLEPRLLVKLADISARYIRTLPGDSRLLYHQQCFVFNHTLKLFQPSSSLQGHRAMIPNSYLWEAQRILLDTSGGQPKPLLLDKGAFQAIRGVLAGLQKNQTEIHSATRHLETWPPYLRPADGMDERMDPEESWTRTVRAGMMMQEAGFPKSEVDEALDILQGLAPDGTPTIQQRITARPTTKLSVWAASIRATRNSQEAWAKFQQPPQPDQLPGLDEYAAMFSKLFARDAYAGTGKLAGDNSLNFPTHQEPNLAEFERARLRPPSVDELYKKMVLRGIKPSGECLAVLVSNAESLDTAHRYLLESDTEWAQYACLLSDHPNPETLKNFPLYLLKAYVDVCAREGRNAGRNLARAIRLAALSLNYRSETSTVFMLGPILKNLGQGHQSLGIGFQEQLSLVLELLQRVRVTHSTIPLSIFYYFSRCLQKIMRRETPKLLADLEGNNSGAWDELGHLYETAGSQAWETRRQAETTGLFEAAERLTFDELCEQSPLFLVRLAAFRMKQGFNALVEKEKEVRQLVNSNEVSAFDEMLSRRDPVQARYAYDYMMALAYAGEFQEMAKVLKWLVQEWGQPKIVQQLEEMDRIPYEADMLTTLCAFRAFAEPMLSQEETASVIETMNAEEVGWVWPDDEMVQAYIEGHGEEEPHDDLRQFLFRTRQRQKENGQGEGRANPG